MQIIKTLKPKRLLAIMLTLCMALTMLPGGLLTPQEASAATPITTRLDFTTILHGTDRLDSEGWKWESGNILTLNGLDLTHSTLTEEAILLPANSTIILFGINSIKQTSTQGNGIDCEGNLTIEGSGSLFIDATFCGLFAQGNLIINGGSGTIKNSGTSGDWAVYAGGTITAPGVTFKGHDGSSYNISAQIQNMGSYYSIVATSATSTPLKDIQFAPTSDTGDDDDDHGSCGNTGVGMFGTLALIAALAFVRGKSGR